MKVGLKLKTYNAIDAMEFFACLSPELRWWIFLISNSKTKMRRGKFEMVDLPQICQCVELSKWLVVRAASSKRVRNCVLIQYYTANWKSMSSPQ